MSTETEPSQSIGEMLDMPLGVNHIKMVTPDPENVSEFLSHVVGLPTNPVETLGGQGPLGMFGVAPPPTEPHPPVDDGSGVLPLEQVYTARGADGTGGYTGGSLHESRRFQVFRGQDPHIWAVAIGAPDIEAAHAKCQEKGYPVTDIHVVTPFGKPEERCRYFFTRVGGIIFELMRREAAPT